MPNFMNKTVIAAGIAVAVIAVSIAYGAQMNPDEDDENRTNGQVWQMRISGPEFHDLPIFGSELGVLGVGTYEISFVPMGDSPEFLNLTITDESGGQIFVEDFTLNRELVDTGISKYYTWEYSGEKFVSIGERDEYEISILREGNLKGSLSISLIKVDRSI